MKLIPYKGEPIAEPGFYSGVPIDRYHSGRLCVGPSVSSSGLRSIFYDSEEDFWDGSPLNKASEKRPETEALILGRAAHHLLLGEPEFNETFVVRPESYPSKDGAKPWSGNAIFCRKWLAEAAKEGMTVLHPEMLERIRGMALKIGEHPLVRRAGVLSGLVETTMAWQDESGVWLLARPDVIPTDSGDFVDLKSTTSTQIDDITKAIGSYGYHQQAALVAEGWKRLSGEEISSFSFMFVRSKRPYSCRMVTLKPEDIELGMAMNRNAIKRFVRGLNTGDWPPPGGLQEQVVYVDISDRERRFINEELERWV